MLESEQSILKKLYKENCYRLDREYIIKLNKSGKYGDLNNVVVGVQKHCYLMRVPDEIDIKFDFIYIRRKNDELSGDLIQLRDDNYADQLIFAFALDLNNSYDDLNPIDTYNTFQLQKRNAYEMLDFFTIKHEELKPYIKNNSVDVMVKQRGVKVIYFIDKYQYYENIFNNIHLYKKGMNGEFIYLMLDKQNSSIKIGKSINPLFREKTLQSQLPKIEAIAIWSAPPEIEKHLHKQFANKRLRGEWFNLSLEDLHVLKDQMANYNIQ